MRHAWIPIAGLGACSVLAVLVLSNVSWAAAKQTIVSCKCTCQFEDELGKPHYGQEDAVAFTASSLENCLNHPCTASVPTGTYTGVTRNCTGTEKSAVRVPPGGVPAGVLQPSGGTTAT